MQSRGRMSSVRKRGLEVARWGGVGEFGRVATQVCVFEEFNRDVGVNLGGFKAGVAEHGLDGPKVATVLQKQRGEGVPEKVATSLLAYGRFADDFGHLCSQSARRDPASLAVEEEGVLIE